MRTIPKQSIMFRTRVSVIYLSAAAFLLTPFASGFVSAQAVTTQSEARANPAPWRPAFTPINNSTQPSNATNSTASLSSGNSQSAASVPAAVSSPVSQSTPGSGSASSSPSSTPGWTASQSKNPGTDNSNSATTNSATTNTPNTNSNQSDNDSASNEPLIPGVTRVTHRMDQLPNSAGQVWREYDITPYTSQIKNSDKPQQAILDWILRETGNEMWFNQPLGILNANKNYVYVYHTPEIQNVVKNIVDRFVRTRGQLQNVDINMVTVANPNWRAQSYTMLQPIDVKTPGVEAWMISKENAALLQGQLQRRGDFKQHSAGTLTQHDGQEFVLEKTRPVQFIRNLRWVPNQIPNYQPLMTNINEGYSLSISCLSSLDNNTIEATIKCNVDQVEKLNNVAVNIPNSSGTGGTQTMNLQVPQLVSWRLHERFRWPNDQVLLLSCGVVATPEPETSGGLRLPGLKAKSKRADALLFVEYRGPATDATMPRTAGSGLAPVR